MRRIEVRAAPGDTSAYDPHCTRCRRLATFLQETRRRYPDYWGRPVPSFGAPRPRIVIIGLAPGLHGANRTGRPFTGDHAGILLYETLFAAGLASASVSSAADDPLQLVNARIVNAVKCVPPANKPLPEEIRRCNGYLAHELRSLEGVRVYLALGRIAHTALLMALDIPRARHAFAHGCEHRLDATTCLIDSYHCSRYNTATRRLTVAMFRAVVARACERADLPVPAGWLTGARG
jgi:uracil-DNA glycosylase family 4